MGCGCFSTPLENQHDELKNDGFSDWPFIEFFLSDLTKATKNFSANEIISENREESSNVVYKGLLSEILDFVAIKRFKNSEWSDHEEFAEDAKAVGELKHKRLVNLIGFCCDEDERLLVAEFMPNDNLATRLFNQKNQTMEWSMRLRVGYCIAEALEYCNSAGFASYNNLSAYSVLFDKEGDPCLSSFGLIKAINYDRSQRTRGIVNPKSVTYRFGTILVNLLTGKQIPPSHAPEMINGKCVTELMDPNLKGKFSSEEAFIVFKLASQCLQCENRKSLITKELVATLKALQTKTQTPYIQMLELAKPHEVGASSSQQQQQEVRKGGYCQPHLKCRLSENLGFVAVKRFKNTPWDDPDYFTEDAKTAGELKHKRLVKLLGYCCEEDEGLLVAEFMPNDTLAKRLFQEKNMEWSMRLRVAYHIAEALDYCTSVRFDEYHNLSAYTVLFDKDGDACLSSFGFVREIIRYNRREGGNVSTGNVTYRFGTILLNLLTGVEIPPSHALEMINGKDVTELMDPNLKGKFSTEEATVVLKLASECLQWKDYIENRITKELVATLEALQAKKEIPSSEMPETTKQQEEASSSSQQPP
ncbi:Serine-threonine/tyrosine-protein kinase catalytic domain [Arabidopsis thaliana x Arabidopsis arenosa]|uniref:Serine/threonine-protein kinase BSK n=1 Tax=Arabidopsis thaliana x Arabidopsis arenosa TaxID=1240361 RepID=A0A8T2B361_9BRAS|nr:Serine-threonine/tyrosine-protein kinase catalytic domain [Arabidopsis thaliana x Arabidopsis arenosa]